MKLREEFLELQGYPLSLQLKWEIAAILRGGGCCVSLIAQKTRQHLRDGDNALHLAEHSRVSSDLVCAALGPCPRHAQSENLSTTFASLSCSLLDRVLLNSKSTRRVGLSNLLYARTQLRECAARHARVLWDVMVHGEDVTVAPDPSVV